MFVIFTFTSDKFDSVLEWLSMSLFCMQITYSGFCFILVLFPSFNAAYLFYVCLILFSMSFIFVPFMLHLLTVLYMCVYPIMLMFVCILCYYVYSVKSSWELVFIVIQKPNSNKVFLSYLILPTLDEERLGRERTSLMLF
jgi:hypothetical protein